MKNLGEAKYILGFKIYWDRSKQLIKISQRTYTDKLFTRHGKFKEGYSSPSNMVYRLLIRNVCRASMRLSGWTVDLMPSNKAYHVFT